MGPRLRSPSVPFSLPCLSVSLAFPVSLGGGRHPPRGPNRGPLLLRGIPGRLQGLGFSVYGLSAYDFAEPPPPLPVLSGGPNEAPPPRESPIAAAAAAVAAAIRPMAI